jgi:hypothetical protein
MSSSSSTSILDTEVVQQEPGDAMDVQFEVCSSGRAHTATS